MQQALRSAQRITYIRGIALAHQEWLAEDFDRANLILEQCGPAEIRGFEWHYLRGLFQARGALSVEGYLEGPSMVSPGSGTNGIALATIYRNNAVSVVAAATAEEVFSFPASTNNADWLVMALSATGDCFATANRKDAGLDVEGTITLWDQPSRRVLRVISVPRLHSVNSISFSPDGGTLAAGLSILRDNGSPIPSTVVGGCVMWWDVATGSLAQSVFVPSNGVWKISFTPDATRILGLHQGGLSLWDATSGSHLRTMEQSTASPWSTAGFALAPGGRHVALPSGHGEGIRVLDLDTGKETGTFFGLTDTITSVAYSRDGRWFAAGSRSGTVRIWDVSTHRQVRMFRHPWSVDVVGFSPDSQELLVGNGRVGVERAKHLLNWDFRGHMLGRSRVLSKEGQRSEFLIWDLETPQEGKNLKHHEGGIWTVAFSPDGRLLASTGSDGIVALWDLEQVKVSVTLAGHLGAVHGAAFSPVDHRVATAGNDQTVRIWDRRSGELLHSVTDHQRWVNTVAYSPDGSLLASASGDGTVKVRNGTSGEVLLEFAGHKVSPSDQATTVIFSPQSREIASAGYDGRVRLWDPTNGQERLSLVHKGRVLCVAYSPDGQAIAACTARGDIRLWAAKSGREILDIRGQLPTMRSVAFNPNGQRLATTSGGNVRIIDAISGLEILTLPGGSNLVAFSPDGRYLAAGGPGGTVRLWDGTPNHL